MTNSNKPAIVTYSAFEDAIERLSNCDINADMTPKSVLKVAAKAIDLADRLDDAVLSGTLNGSLDSGDYYHAADWSSYVGKCICDYLYGKFDELAPVVVKDLLGKQSKLSELSSNFNCRLNEAL